MRLLGEAANEAQEARLLLTRLLATKGIHAEPIYPDISNRQKAWAVVQTFVGGDAAGTTLLP